jgi:hypothetical protein
MRKAIGGAQVLIMVILGLASTTGTAAAGQAGYAVDSLSHSCFQLINSGVDQYGNEYQGVHCADLLVQRVTATSVDVIAQGQALCQWSRDFAFTFTLTTCDTIGQSVGLYTSGAVAIVGPVRSECGSNCPVGARYVHSYRYRLSSGCLDNVWSSMTDDGINYNRFRGVGNIASAHFRICNNGVYTQR